MDSERPIQLLASIGFAILAGVLLWWASSPELGDLGGDSTVYVLTARAYSFWMPHDAIAAAAAAGSQYPPLYPLSLAPALAIAGLRGAHFVTALELCAGLLAYAAWLRATGLGAGRAATLTFLVTLLPGTYWGTLFLHSENLYLAFSLCALIALCQPASQRTLTLAALLVALAYLTRSAGISLLAPLALYAWRLRQRAALVPLAAALAPFGAWNLLHAHQNSYLSILLARFSEAPLDVARQQFAQSWGLVLSSVSENLGASSALRLPILLLTCLMLLSAAIRLLKGKPDAVYLAAYFFVIQVWYFPDEMPRFIWVVLPILLAQPVLLAGEIAARAPRARPLAPALALLALIVLVIELPTLAITVQRYRMASAGNQPELRFLPLWYSLPIEEADREGRDLLTLTHALERIPEQVPADDCVISVKPALTEFFGSRRGAPPSAPESGDAEFAQRLRSSGCHYVFLISYPSPSFPSWYPARRIRIVNERAVLFRTIAADGQAGPALAILAPILEGG